MDLISFGWGFRWLNFPHYRISQPRLHSKWTKLFNLEFLKRVLPLCARREHLIACATSTSVRHKRSVPVVVQSSANGIVCAINLPCNLPTSRTRIRGLARNERDNLQWMLMSWLNGNYRFPFLSSDCREVSLTCSVVLIYVRCDWCSINRYKSFMVAIASQLQDSPFDELVCAHKATIIK